MNLRRLLPLAIACLQPILAAEAEAGPRSRPVRTGLTTCYDAAGAVIPCAGTGQDGELKRGEPRSYVDNGDGTIRDKRAGLTWEKLSDDDSVHDKDNTYKWQQAFEKIDDLNDASFAGFDDWRCRTPSSSLTLLDHGAFDPALPPAFNSGCTAGCTVLTCSCKGNPSGAFWSSTTLAACAAWGLGRRLLRPARPTGRTSSSSLSPSVRCGAEP